LTYIHAYGKIKASMKLRTTTPASRSISARVTLVIISVFLLIATPIGIVTNASADQYDEQIKALQQDIDAYNAQSAILAEQSKTLQSAVAVLQNQANAIQAQIDISQAKYDQLVAKIAETEQKIKNNQDALGTTIANMYVDDEISPLELLAGSKNISEYMDRQEYRASVRDELTSTISQVKKLKADLETQKVEAGRVLEDQKNQRSALIAKQNEQQSLLDKTQGQEAAYQKLVAQSGASIAQLRSQQAAENAARAANYGGGYTSMPGDGTRGGYPSAWMNAPLDAYVDPWGMYTRECVSYAAIKVNQAYGNMPYWGGVGNANQWDDNARRMGIPIGTTPKPGSVGVIDGGYYGHVAWVESVNGNGTINISHFNVNWSGDYSEWYNLRPTYFNYYIYFGEW
jgi:surface antigen/peptidoglycan hydrolase CwlO-like protein